MSRRLAGLAPIPILSIFIKDEHVFAGTYSSGVWRRLLSEIGIVGIIPSLQNIPAEYSLDQNYPNPFNPVTTIKYGLPEDSRVTLEVFNVLGQVIAKLADEVQSAGFKSVVWNGADAASGIYFYKLGAQSVSELNRSFRLVRKVVLLK